MSYETSEIARQQILDYLNAQPVGYAPSGLEVMTGTGLPKTVWHSCVKTMCYQREMEKIGKGKTVRYRALVKTTISAADLRAQVVSAMKASGNVCTAPPPRSTKGRYVHVAGHYESVPGHVQGQPLRNQGGQGAVRRQFTIQASAGMLWA